MGDPLSKAVFKAFGDDLIKNAGIGQSVMGGARWLGQQAIKQGRLPTKMGLSAAAKISKGAKGVMGDLSAAAQRVAKPIEGVQEGWRQMAPTAGMADKARSTGKSVSETHRGLREAVHAAQDPKILGKAQSNLREFLPGGEHLLQPGKTMREAAATPGLAAKGKAIAEEASRRGWTGAGKKTKYAPVGQKGLLVGFGGLGIADAASAPAATPMGEGGALERGLGEVGSGLGMVAAGGLGMVPGAALWYGANKAGRYAGRLMDRYRSGATLDQMLNAPSPQEVEAQMKNVTKFYG